jgi:hypothetical protein
MEVALSEMKGRQRFGLVFEEHIPETMALYGLPIQAGSLVQKRDNPQASVLLGATPSAEDPLSQRARHRTGAMQTSENLPSGHLGENSLSGSSFSWLRGGPARAMEHLGE